MRGQGGQSTVEYILLLAVIVSLFTKLYGSDSWKKYFGQNSQFFKQANLYLIYSVKNADGRYNEINQSQGHDLYQSPDNNKSRFFFSLGAYE